MWLLPYTCPGVARARPETCDGFREPQRFWTRVIGMQAGSQAASIKIAAAVVLGALMLSWVAFYNGFPLLFWDSMAYIGLAVDDGFFWARSRSYSEFIWLLHWQWSLWPVIFVHGLIASHLIYLTARVVLGRVSPIGFMALIAGLAVFSSVAWTVAWIMPDLFTPVVVLGLFLLGFGADRLSVRETLYVFGLTAVAIHFHNSHVPLAVGLLGTILLARAFLDHPGLRGLVASAALLAGPILLAIAASLTVNFEALGRFTLTPNSHFLPLGRLVADGPAVEYLKDSCREQPYALCAYLDELPMPEYIFLWKNDAPISQAGGFDALNEEAREIVYGTLQAYPAEAAADALSNTYQQLIDFQIGFELLPYDEMVGLHALMLRIFPGEMDAFMSSRQDAGTLPVQTTRLIHGAALLISLLALGPLCYLGFVGARGLRSDAQQRWLGLVITTGSALLGNAFITGALSKIESRYTSRLVWLVVLAAALGVTLWLRTKTSPPNAHDPRERTNDTGH